MNLNSTNDTVMDNSTRTGSEQCSLLAFITDGVLTFIVCMCGIVGNIVIFVVFQRDPQKSPTSYLFQALAFADNVLLVLCIPNYVIPALTKYIHATRDAFNTFWFPYIQVYVFPVCLMAQAATIWVTVLVGINRYIAVCVPYKAITLGSMQRIRYYLLIVVISCIFFGSPLYVCSRISYKNSKYDGEDVLTPVPIYIAVCDTGAFARIYFNVLYTILLLLVPLFALSILNSKLITTLNALRKKRSEMQSRQQQQDNNVTLVLIIVIIVFTVCQTPALVNQILWSFLDESWRICGQFHYYWRTFSNLMVIVNSAVNFIVYFLFNNRFRQILFKCTAAADNAPNTNGPSHRLATVSAQRTNMLKKSSPTDGETLLTNIQHCSKL